MAVHCSRTATNPLSYFQSVPSAALTFPSRLAVGTSDIDWLIGGFIVTGNGPKKVIVRAIGALPQPVSSHLLIQLVDFH